MKTIIYDYLKYRNIKYDDDIDSEINLYIKNIISVYPQQTKQHLIKCLDTFNHLESDLVYIYFHNYSLIVELSKLHDKIDYAYNNLLDYYSYILQYKQAYIKRKDDIRYFSITPDIILNML